MKPGVLKEMIDQRPFQPFEIRMTDGKVYQIRYPNYAVLMKTILFIGDPDSDSFAFCALDQIASVNVPQAA
jgi:hypothetical protein